MPSQRPSTGATSASPTLPAVEVEGLTKRFGTVVACDAVDMALRRGRIHGVLGENGAGKSTLMRMLIGLELPDAGHIRRDGDQCHIANPIDAAALGIGMVHQHLSLVDPLTVWENVALGEGRAFDPDRIRAHVLELGARYGLDVDPDARVADLTPGMRQRVEIIKCLQRRPEVLILDEPTSLLTPDEAVDLFGSLRRMVHEEDRAVALVSHKLDEMLDATDSITVMRHGRVTDRLDTADADAATLARAMIGRSVVWRGAASSPPPAPSTTDPALRISGAKLVDRAGHAALDGLDLSADPGEILGVAGIDGNGQHELVDVVSSLVALDAGTVEIDGVVVETGRAGAMGRAGIGVIPADRHDSGVVLEMSVAENLTIMDVAAYSRAGVMDQRRMHARARELIDEYEIECEGPDAPMWSLSGGSQQRVVLARELSRAPRVLVAAQPTRGLDVGAIEYLNGRLRAAADDGIAVLLISAEIDEILDLSHRIVVLSRGAVIGEMPGPEADRQRLGLLLGGQRS